MKTNKTFFLKSILGLIVCLQLSACSHQVPLENGQLVADLTPTVSLDDKTLVEFESSESTQNQIGPSLNQEQDRQRPSDSAAQMQIRGLILNFDFQDVGVVLPVLRMIEKAEGQFQIFSGNRFGFYVASEFASLNPINSLDWKLFKYKSEHSELDSDDRKPHFRAYWFSGLEEKEFQDFDRVLAYLGTNKFGDSYVVKRGKINTFLNQILEGETTGCLDSGKAIARSRLMGIEKFVCISVGDFPTQIERVNQSLFLAINSKLSANEIVGELEKQNFKASLEEFFSLRVDRGE